MPLLLARGETLWDNEFSLVYKKNFALSTFLNHIWHDLLKHKVWYFFLSSEVYKTSKPSLTIPLLAKILINLRNKLLRPFQPYSFIEDKKIKIITFLNKSEFFYLQCIMMRKTSLRQTLGFLRFMLQRYLGFCILCKNLNLLDNDQEQPNYYFFE